jgi:protein-S-isoprenylcysteine O-methyltransferase Ste14
VTAASRAPRGGSRIPALGPHGEGWVALQGVCIALLAAAIYAGPRDDGADPALTGTRQLLGYFVGVIGATLIGSGIAELRRGRSLSALPRPKDGATFVASGAYRLVRHPIYGGLVLAAIGLAVITPWAGTFVATALLALVLDLKRRREEIWLGERYPGYAAYRAMTRALIPFLY